MSGGSHSALSSWIVGNPEIGRLLQCGPLVKNKPIDWEFLLSLVSEDSAF
jgi:hypothetical protein